MIALVLLLFMNQTSHSSLPQDDAFQKGVRLMQEQKYSEAATVFESEYKNGKNFPALFYNWGLSEYRLQKRGLALALWRKALYLDPELEPAREAIHFILNELPRENLDGTKGWVAFKEVLLSRMTLNKLLFMSWICFTFGAVLLIRYWGRRKRALKNTLSMPKAPVIGMIFSIFFIVALILSVAKGFELSEARATVISSAVQLRTGPSSEDNSIFELIEGLEVVVRQVQDSWALVTIQAGPSGWVPVDSLFQSAGKAKLW